MHIELTLEPKVILRGNIFSQLRYRIFHMRSWKKGQAPKPYRVESDYNCFFRVANFQESSQIEAKGLPTITTFKQWQRMTGQDRHSIEADPMFVNPEKGDFRLKRSSPCRRRGPKKDGKPTDIGVDWDEFFGKK